MAVSASHDALRDLGFDASPTRAPRDHQREVERLVPQVVELQHDDVALAAIDAWVGEQIFDRLGARLSAPAGAVATDALPHRLRVLPVVLLVSLGEARAAPGLKLVWRGSSDGRELVKRFRLAAARAGPHLHTWPRSGMSVKWDRRTGSYFSFPGPVAQWIEQWTSNPCARVRFPPGLPIDRGGCDGRPAFALLNGVIT